MLDLRSLNEVKKGGWTVTILSILLTDNLSIKSVSFCMNINWLIEKITQSDKDYPDKIFSVKNKIYTCVNPYKYHMLRKNSAIYKEMDGIFIDGILMVWMVKLLFRKSVRRLSFDMTTIAKDLFGNLNLPGNTQSVYFLGTEQPKIEDAVKNYKKKYPNMNIVGYRNGYFIDVEDRNKAISDIINKNPDYAIIGLGGVIQEQFAFDLKQAGFEGIVFTCGGFLHQSSNAIDYFPDWVNKFNLRMPYRLIKERNFSRLHYFFSFMYQFTIDKLITKFNNEKTQQ